MPRFESRIARVLSEPPELIPNLAEQTSDGKLDRDFLMYNAQRKLDFAKTLVRQYTKEIDKLENDFAVPGENWYEELHDKTKETLGDHILELNKLIELEKIIKGDTKDEKTIEAARKIAGFAFPFETEHYSDDDLKAKLDVKQNRLEYLTETSNTQIPKATRAGLDPDFALRAEADDLKNQINQIQGAITRRGVSTSVSGHPNLHEVQELPNISEDTVWDTSEMGDSVTQLMRKERRSTETPVPLAETIILKKPNQKIDEARQRVEEADLPSKRDLVYEEIEQLLDTSTSTLDADARVTILANKEFVDNLITAGYTPGSGEDNRQILAKEVINQFKIFGAELKKNFPGVKYNEVNAEPVVGLWGSLTNKVKKIKETDAYNEFKTFFDFSKAIPGLQLKAKEPKRSPGVIKKTMAAGAGLLGAAGVAYAASQGGGSVEPGIKPIAKIADSKPEKSKVQPRGQEAETIHKTAKKGVEQTASTYDDQTMDETPSSEPRRALEVTKKAQPRAIHKPRPTIHQIHLTPLDDLVDPRKERGRAQAQQTEGSLKPTTESKKIVVQTVTDRMGKTELPVDATGNGPETHRLAHENDTADDNEDDGADDEVTTKYKESLQKDGREVILVAKPLKEKLEGLRPLLGSIMNDKRDVNMWVEKLGVALEDALRLTPAEKRADVIKALEEEIAKAQNGDGLEIKKANAMSKKFRNIFKANSSSDQAPDIMDGFERMLLK